MKKYIPLDALVAEIEKETKTLRQEIPSCENKEHKKGKLFGLQRALYLIDTLEMKGVDIEKEVNEHWDEWAKEDGFHSIDFAKHFYELGLKAAQKEE